MKKVCLYLVFIICVFITPLNVFAKIVSVLETDKDISFEESLNITIKLEQSGDREEISVYRAVIEYDENVFSGIDESSFDMKSGWSDIQYNEKNHTIILVNKFGSTGNEEVVSFDLTVRDDIVPAETSIKLTNQIVSNEVGDYVLDDVSNGVDVYIELADVGLIQSDGLTSGAPLVENRVQLYHVLTLIVLELIIAIVLVMIYKVAKKRISNVVFKKSLFGVLAVIEVFALSAFVTYDIHTGDLDGDGVIGQEDIEILAKHLVNKEMLSPFSLESADMNKDGKVTPSDLSVMIYNSDEKRVYEVQLANAVMESNGYEKGDLIDLHFVADVTNGEAIEYVILDGEKYDVELVNDNEYVVKVSAATVSNKYSLVISEVILANGKSAAVDYGTDVLVLKDIPTLSAFSTKENVADGSVKVALTITDEDDAIVSSKYELVNSSGKIVANGNLDKGKNTLDLKLDNAVYYKLKLKIEYNRGMDSGEYLGSIEDEYDLRVITDYKLVMNDFNLVQNGNNTQNIEKNSQTYLTFTSSNVSGYAPRKLTVNDREYTVTSLGNGMYQISIPNTVLDGSDLKITKTTLANGKVILVDSAVSYTVLKSVPTITNLVASEATDDSFINVKFDVDDPDDAITALVVRLTDDLGKITSEQEVYCNHCDFDLPTTWTSRYTVRVYADYSIGDSIEYIDKILYEETLDAIMRADLSSFEAETVYPDKNSIINLDYIITSNYYVNVKQIVINNIIYDVMKVGLNNYRVEVAVGGDAGLADYTTKKIIFENGQEFNVDSTVTIDVLKDYPVLDNYSIAEDIEDRRIDISFDLFDLDESFRSGQIKLVNKGTDEVVESKNVILGKNKATFTLENAVKYEIRIDVDGTLDTESLEDEAKNKYTDYNLYSNEYRIVNDYMLKIGEVETLNDDVVTDKFEENADIEVRFASTNVTDYVPIKVKVNGKYYDVTQVDGKYRFVIPGFASSGLKTLCFESIVLSNYKEVSINAYKVLHILKSAPTLEEIVLDNTEGNNVRANIRINDDDETLLNLKAIVLDLDGNELFNGSVDDGKFEFDGLGNESYTIRILASYDLNGVTGSIEENVYTDVVIYDNVVDLINPELELSEIGSAILYEEETDEVIDNITTNTLEHLDKLKIKLIMSDGSVRIYDIGSYIIDDDKVKFVLNHNGWVTTLDKKKTNMTKIEFDFTEED